MTTRLYVSCDWFSAHIEATDCNSVADHTSLVCWGIESIWRKKIKEVLQKTEENVEVNEVTLGTNKIKDCFFSGNSTVLRCLSNIKVFTTQKCYKYLDFEIDRALIFDEQLRRMLRIWTVLYYQYS